MNLGGPELLVILILLVMVVVPIWALIDVVTVPQERFEVIGQSRTVWLVLLVIGIVCLQLLGLVAGAYYLVAVRPKLRATG